jgi:outer membrane autotransporter protein
MKRILSAALCFTALTGWSAKGVAQRQTAVGVGNIPLNATGILHGVDMSASSTTGTLIVGVPGGPETDIFTLNNPVLPNTIAVSTGASSQGNIVFNSSSTIYGAVGVTQPGGPFLLAITGGNALTAVNFLGPVFATTLNVTGTGAVNFNSGSTNITATNFAADGTIALAPNTTVIGALTTTAGANTGTLTLGGGSVLNGAVGGAIGIKAIGVTGGSNAAGVSATITGATNAYTFSLGTNTLLVGGALTIANSTPSGTINTTLASPTVYGNIVPVGAVNLGPTVAVHVTVPSTAFIPVGSQFGIVKATSGTSGSIVAVTVQDPTNPLYKFAAVPTAGTAAGSITIQVTSIPLLVPVTPDPSVPPGSLPPVLPIAAAIVPVLLATPTSPDLIGTVLPAINALSDPVAVVNAVAQLAPSAAALAAPLVTFQMGRQFQDLGMSHLTDTLCSLAARRPEDGDSLVCPVDTQRSGMWIKGFGQVSSQNAQGAFAGYDAAIYGTMIGYDMPLGPETRAGVAVGVGRGVIDGKGFNSNVTMNSYNAMAYIGRETGTWFVNGDIAFGWNDYTSERHISFPGLDRTAAGNYSGQEYTAFASTGYHFATPVATVTPFVSLQYTHMDLGSYTETGAGDISLRVSPQRYDFVESGLGVKVAHPFVSGNKTFVPEVHFIWFHELNNPNIQNTAAFSVSGSPSFNTPGLRGGDDSLNIGARFAIFSCVCDGHPWSLEAGYDYYWSGQGYSAQRGTVRFVTRF